MVKPIRIQLSRRKGFDLHALSRKFNGLDVVKVARPGRWGNPFIVNEHVKAGAKSGAGYICVPTVEDAVECFRLMMLERQDWIEEARRDLGGKNIACWCKPGAPCHGDVLLEMANG